MDELDVVTRLREGVPAIDDDAVRSARRRLYAEMERPARVAGPWARRGAMVAGLAAVLTGGLTVAQNVGGSDDGARLPGGPVAAADVALIAQRAQTSAEARPDMPLRPGTWTYVRDLIQESDGNAITKRSRRTTLEYWFTADGVWTASQGKGVRRRDPRDEPKPGFLIGAPADPAGMRARIYAEVDRIKKAMARPPGPGDEPIAMSIIGIDTSRSRDVVAFELIRQVLRAYYVPPRLQAAMYGVLAYIPGVKVLPDSVDAAGRHGQAFYITDSQGVRAEIILDRRTFQYLGTRDIFGRDWTDGTLHFRKGMVIGLSAKVASGVVSRPGQRP